MRTSEKIICKILEQADQTDFHQFIRENCENLLEVLRAQKCFLFTFDRKSSELYTFYSIEKSGRPSQLDVLKTKKGVGIVGWVAENLRPLLVVNAAADERVRAEPWIFDNRQSTKDKDRPQSVLAVPLMVFGQLLGVLEIISHQRKFSVADIKFLHPWVNMISLATPRENGEALTQLAEVCVRFLEERDRYTHGHSLRVARYAVVLADECGLSPAEKKELRLCALLHDIGKVTLRDSLLMEEKKLTKLELQLIRMHTVVGFNIVSKVNKSVAHKILAHHENFNGSGYPHGLKGEQIPLISRIINLADSVDAMTTNRPYRQALDIDLVIKEIRTGSGIQFDPRIVEAFLAVYRQGKIKFNEGAA